MPSTQFQDFIVTSSHRTCNLHNLLLQIWRSPFLKAQEGLTTQERWWATLSWHMLTSKVLTHMRSWTNSQSMLYHNSPSLFPTQSILKWQLCCLPPACVLVSCSPCWLYLFEWPAGHAGSEITDLHPSREALLLNIRKMTRMRMTQMKKKMTTREREDLCSQPQKGRRYTVGRKWLMWAKRPSGRRGLSAERWSCRRSGWMPIWMAAHVK